MPVASIRPGTIRKPPPIPKKPEAAPAASATAAVTRHILRSTGRFSTDVGFLDFDISDNEIEALYAKGYAAAEKFLSTWDWDAYLDRFR